MVNDVGSELAITWASLFIKCSIEERPAICVKFVWPVFEDKQGKDTEAVWLLELERLDWDEFIETDGETEIVGKAIDSISCPTEFLNMVIELVVDGKFGLSKHLFSWAWDNKDT